MSYVSLLKPLRSLIDLKVEYRIRRGLYGLLPVSHQSRAGSILHFCLPKTASQFVRLVLSDPLVYQGCGKKPYPVTSLADKDEVLATATENRIFLGMFWTRHEVGQAVSGNRAFFVYRDPIDLFVSWYVSQRYTHPSNQRVAEFRRKTEKMKDVDAMRVLMNDFGRLAEVLASWSQFDAQEVFKVAFSDLTGSESVATWMALLAHLEIRMGEKQLEVLLRRYRRWLFEASPSAKYSYDKTEMRRQFDEGIGDEWSARFGWLYRLDIFQHRVGRNSSSRGSDMLQPTR
jgi:hypothetical protein